MKKVLSMLCVLLAFTLVGCDKENDVNGNDQPSGGGTSSVDIESINIPSSLEMDVDWTDGVALTVSLSPSGTSMSDVTAIGYAEDVISVEKTATGFLLKPKKIGQTSVTVKATRGAAQSKTCAVKVNEKGLTQATEVETISLSKTSIELADLTAEGTAEYAFVPLTLSPSNVTVNDLTLSCSDSKMSAELVAGDPVALRVSIPANSSHAATDVRTSKITISPRRGSASSAVLSVKVCGHVYGLALNVPVQYLESGEVHFTYGEKVALTPALTTTGELKAGGDKITYTCPGGLSVTDNKLYCLSSSNLTGASSYVTLKASCGLSQVVELKVHTYVVPTDILVDDHMPEDKKGVFKVTSANYRVSVKVVPAEARPRIKYTRSGSALQKLTADETDSGLMLDFEAAKSTKTTESFTFTAGTFVKSWTYIVNDYDASDAKVGDYVYWSGSPSNPTFRRSDGGLRAIGSDWWRRESPTLDTKPGETLLGVIYDTEVPGLDDIPSNMKKGIGGQHFAVLAAKDVPNGANPRTVKWGSNENVTSFWNTASYGSSPSASNSHTYQVWKGMKAYKSHFPFVEYVEAFSSTIAVPSSGTTGWMLPTKTDAESFSAPYAGVLKGSLSSSYPYDMYWTSSYATSNDAWGFSWKNNLGNITCETASYTKNNTYKLRPVLIL